MRSILVTVLCAVAVSTAALAQDEAVSLRPKFVEGRSTRYEFWSQRDEAMTTQFGANERSMNVLYKFAGEITWDVVTVRGDGSADCRMTIDWFSLEISANGETNTADSRKGSTGWDDGTKFVKALAGKPLTVRVAADGVIEKVDGVSAITSQIEGDEDGKPDETDFKEEAATLALLWGAPASLAQGGTWPATFAWNHEMGTLNYKTTFTLNDVGELEGVPVAMVSSASKLSLDFEKPDLPPDAPPITMKFDGGEEHEQVIWDLYRGEAIARNVTQTLKTTQSIRLDQGQLTQIREETVQGQIVRISEK